MELNGVASAVLVVYFVLSSLVLIVLLAVITITMVRLQAKLEELATRVEPLLGKTDALITLADEKLRVVGDRAETLLATSEEIATTVQVRVDQTTGTVQRTVNAPLIEANAVASGLTRAWETFTRRGTKPVPVTKIEAEGEQPQQQGVKLYGG